MGKTMFGGHSAKLILGFVVSAFLIFGVAACSWFTGDEQQDDAAPVTAAVIEPIEGMKYYVGGPVMREDKYGSMRVVSFNGEVKKPTARGLVIGYKALEGNRFELRTWLNGRPVTEQFGWVGEGGLLWFNERSTLNSDGVVVVRQTLTYDDDKEIMHSKLEHIDPADGQIVKTYEVELPYASPDELDEDEDEDDAEEGDEENDRADAEQD